MKNILISIIVPVYNVEKYLEKCVTSLINQSYKNIEIILVDDGSIDKSGAICDSLVNKDDRIRVIHQKNMGLSAARNTGLDNIKGDYVLFVDSDDWLDINTVNDNLEIAIKTDADMVIFNYYDVYPNKQKLNSYVKTEGNMDLENVFLSGTVLMPVKLYSSRLFQKLRLKKGMIHEDSYIFPFLVVKSKKIVGNTKGYYFYNHTNVGSILHTMNYKHRYDDFMGNISKLELARKYFPDTYNIILNKTIDNFFKLNSRNRLLKFLDDEQKENIQKFLHVCREEKNRLRLKERFLLWEYDHINILGLIKGIFYVILSKK